MPLTFDTIGHYAYNKFDYMNKFLHHIYNSPKTGLTIYTYIDKGMFWT